MNKIFLSVLFVVLSVSPLFAAQSKIVFGPQAYVREKGGPDTFSGSFDVCDPKGTFTITVNNGDADGGNRVSSGTITINGITVVQQKDFNQNVASIVKPVYGITKTGNTIAVNLQSAPGSKITVSVAGIMHCLEVHITSPANGSTISDYGAIFSGTVESQDGAEVGITVNGIPAAVSGKSFAVSGVPMQEGENTITAKATDEDGNVAGDSIKVTLSNPVTDSIYLSSYPASGEAPLDVKFTVDDTIPKAKALYEMDWEGDGVVDFSAQQLSDFESGIAHEYDTEGLFFPTATIKTADGEIFSKKIVLAVSKMPDLGKKWDDMRSALAAGDVQKAVQFISLKNREIYKKNLDVLAEKAPEALQEMSMDMSNLKIYKIVSDYALGDFRITEDGQEVTYGVQFIKDEDGIWRIKNF